MLKILGAVLIVAAGALIGRLQARRLADRPAQIRRLVRLLGQLETEISYGYTPLAEALVKIAGGSTDPICAMIRQIGSRLASEELAVMDIWRETWKEHDAGTALRAPEQEVIVTIGDTLGTTDRDNQVKHLKLAAKQLENIELAAIADQHRYEKMWKSLGLLSGALIAVIMY